MATKKNNTTDKKEDTVKKTVRKKTADTNKKTSAKADKKEDTVKKTVRKKTADTNKKTSAKADKKEDSIKKTAEKSDTNKKNSDIKILEEKTEMKSLKDEKKENSIKKTDGRNIVLKTSSPIRKIESIKTERNENKTERESITLLKEAIKAKSKNVSKPVTVKKRIAVADDNNLNDINAKSTPVNDSNNKADEKKDDISVLNNDAAEYIKDENNTDAPISSAIVSDENTSVYSFETFKENDIKEELKTENNVAPNTDFNNKEDNNINTESIIEENRENEENIEYIEENNIQKEKNDISEENLYIEKTEENFIEEETDSITEEHITEEKSDLKEETTEEKAIYSKSDIFKRTVIIPNNDDHIQKYKFNQEEIDNAIKDAPLIHEDTSIENYQNYSKPHYYEDNQKIQELKDKDIKIIETQDKLKTHYLPEIEKKPAEPYIAPNHSIENNKKSNKIVPIIAIIIIILGLSFLAIQFFSGKNNEADDGFYEIVTNENPADNYLSDTNSLTSNNITNNSSNTIIIPQATNTVSTNTVRPQTNNIVNINAASPQTNNTVNTNAVRPQTNNTLSTSTSAFETIQNNNTDIYKTKWTDTLSSIATSELGDGKRWPSIAVLNENIINNPDNIVFNMDIKIPKAEKKKLEDMSSDEKKALYNDYIKVAEIYLKIGKENLANSIKSQADSILK
ncbi:hypothetical protein [uncultured Brachyspira sp.]|uniref:LysM peptidoglycan-binding domain-containing protein n=1 Tax=uncultured Brachyspira sp. TaxID=221953 RepID=UPI0025EEEC2B|nr:hypothetical protein [uncultured Brachyspira sp.]